MECIEMNKIPEQRHQVKFSGCRWGDHLPLGEELGAVERLADDASSLGRRVGPSGPDDLLHLGKDAGQVVGVLGHHCQVAHPLI